MKICICDDEKDFIHNFQLLLKQYSKKHKNINQFNSFENENDLLSYFYSQNDIDILFLDIKFQTYSGIEIAKKMKEDNVDIKAIMKYTGITKEEIEKIDITYKTRESACEKPTQNN